MTQLPELTPEREALLIQDPKHEHLRLGRFNCWDLYLHGGNQSQFGRAYAWITTRHVDMHEFENVGLHEIRDLQWVVASYRAALADIAKQPLQIVNCEWLGNEVEVHRGHGHMHLIPRFSMPNLWQGIEYLDLNIGKRADYTKREMSERHQKALVQAFRQRLGLTF